MVLKMECVFLSCFLVFVCVCIEVFMELKDIWGCFRATKKHMRTKPGHVTYYDIGTTYILLYQKKTEISSSPKQQKMECRCQVFYKLPLVLSEMRISLLEVNEFSDVIAGTRGLHIFQRLA